MIIRGLAILVFRRDEPPASVQADELEAGYAGGRAAVEQLVWLQIHGHAHLMIDGKLPPEGDSGTGCEPFAAQLDLASMLLPE